VIAKNGERFGTLALCAFHHGDANTLAGFDFSQVRRVNIRRKNWRKMVQSIAKINI
jgi:hypothetical protein